MKYITQILVVVVLLFLLIPNTAYADDFNLAESLQVSLQAGDPAPFEGILLNRARLAEIIVNKESAEKLCDINIKTAVDIFKAKSERDLGIKQAELDYCEGTKDKIIAAQDEYIVKLEKQITKPKIPPAVIMGIGVGLGVGLTVGAGYAIGQVAHGFH